MAIFVLVHVSWHDGAAWEGVIGHLEAMGHKAFAPTAAGYGKGAGRRVTHAQCVQSLVENVVSESLSDFILVGHSFGGTFIFKVAEAIPEKIRRLVSQIGLVVRDGHSVLDESPPATAALFEKMAGESPDNSFLLPFPVWRDAFINDGDLEKANRTYALLAPEPLQPSKDRLDLRKFYSLDIQIYQLHRRYCPAVWRMGVASADVEPIGALPPGADAREPRSDGSRTRPVLRKRFCRRAATRF